MTDQNEKRNYASITIGAGIFIGLLFGLLLKNVFLGIFSGMVLGIIGGIILNRKWNKDIEE